MTELFGRHASLVVGNRSLNGLRISFDVEKTNKVATNKATIVVANLAASTRAEVSTKGARVLLDAGYESGHGVLFLGSSYRVTHARDGADILTRIEAADGGEEVKVARGAWSFTSGTSKAAALSRIVTDLGLRLSPASATLAATKTATFAKGWAFAGRTITALETVVAEMGLRLSIQDTEIVIVDDARPGTVETFVLSTDTGMIGTPERGERDEKTKRERITVKSLILPAIKPDGRVVVASVDDPSVNGLHRVVKVKATGDTHGDDWTMTIALEPV